MAAVGLVAAVGAAVGGAYGALHVRRQDRYGNVRRRDAAIIGGLSVGGVVAGAALAHVVPTRVLELGFAAVLVLAAVQLARRALSTPPDPTGAATRVRPNA